MGQNEQGDANEHDGVKLIVARFDCESADEEEQSYDVHWPSVDRVANVNGVLYCIGNLCLARVHNNREGKEEIVAGEEQDQIESPYVPSCEFVHAKIDYCYELHYEQRLRFAPSGLNLVIASNALHHEEEHH